MGTRTPYLHANHMPLHKSKFTNRVPCNDSIQSGYFKLDWSSTQIYLTLNTQAPIQIISMAQVLNYFFFYLFFLLRFVLNYFFFICFFFLNNLKVDGRTSMVLHECRQTQKARPNNFIKQNIFSIYYVI